MGFMDNVRQRVFNWLMPEEFFNSAYRERLTQQQVLYSYYSGDQRRQIRVKTGQADDNLTLNFVNLIVERGLSMLLGGGVGFDLPGDPDSDQQAYIDNVMAANNQDILLHRGGQYASIFGTGYLKIIPDGVAYKGQLYPRLIPLDSRWMTIHTLPEDIGTVMAYEMRYNITAKNERGDNEEMARKEVTRRGNEDEGDIWVIENYVANNRTFGKWELVAKPERWEYPFPPIVHWANLPQPGSIYGVSDVANIIELQDRVNFTASNISKIIRYHAHPKTWGRNVNLGKTASWGGDEMVTVTGDNAMIANLEMQSDLTSSAAYLETLRQAVFDISRTVDISSMSDKLGALTNFGLRVLYTDALAKRNTKRALMGEALQELVSRLLIMNETPIDDPVAIVWPENMPRDEFQDLQAAQIELQNELVSRQTVATERGRNWEEESERIMDEKAQADNIGAQLIRNFNSGLFGGNNTGV